MNRGSGKVREEYTRKKGSKRTYTYQGEWSRNGNGINYSVEVLDGTVALAKYKGTIPDVAVDIETHELKRHVESKIEDGSFE